MEFYISVLEQDCIPHYFIKSENAIKYLINNVNKSDCKIDLFQENTCGELWDESGISVGYFYRVKTED